MSQVGDLRDVSVTLDVSGLGTLAANANRQVLFIANGAGHDVGVSLTGIASPTIGTMVPASEGEIMTSPDVNPFPHNAPKGLVETVAGSIWVCEDATNPNNRVLRRVSDNQILGSVGSHGEAVARAKAIIAAGRA